MIKYILASYFVCLLAYTCMGQVTDSTKLNNLLVYGEGFSFNVKEPDGWIGDIDNARNYHANIIFYLNEESLKMGGALIQVLIFSKQDEKTCDDLEYDVNSYKKDYPNLKENDFQIVHKEYKCYSRIVFVENEFYQYISYVNPGDKFSNGFSVAMNISERAANDSEMQAFNKIIESLWMMK